MDGFSVKIQKTGKKSGKKRSKTGRKQGGGVFQDDTITSHNSNSKIKLVEVVQSESKINVDKRVIQPQGLGPYGLIKNSDASKDVADSNAKSVSFLLRKQPVVQLDDLPEGTRDEEYKQMPVEEFGKALLRGMGWNSDDEEKSRDKKQKRHAALPHEYAGIGTNIKGPATNIAADPLQNFMPIKRQEKIQK